MGRHAQFSNLMDFPSSVQSGEYLLLSGQVGYGYTAAGPSSTAANSNNRGRITPFTFYETREIDALAIHIIGTNAGVGAVVRLGIYTNNGGEVGTVVVDAGTSSINASGVKTVTFTAVEIPAGDYFAAAYTQDLDTAGGNPTMSVTQTSTQSVSEPTPAASNNMFPTYIVTQSGALANNPTTSIVRSTTSGCPHIWARLV